MRNPLFVLFFLSLRQLTFSYEEARFKHCGTSSSSRYTANSTFLKNLNEAFNILRNNTALTNFNATTIVGDGTEPVTALALCRGDLTPSVCQPCIKAATTDIFELCPNQPTDSELWYNFCMIRYSSENFLTIPDNNILMLIWDGRDAPKPDIYNEKVQEVAQNLSISAGASKERYALGWTSLSNTEKLYGYQECTRDLSSEDCTNCLIIAKKNIETCCLGKWAGWIATPSCAIRFNIDPIYNESTVSAPEIYTANDLATPPTLSPPPPLHIPSGASDRNGGSGIIGLVLGVTVGGAMVLILVTGSLCLWFVKDKKRKKMMRRGSGIEVQDSDGQTTIMDDVMSFLFEFDILVMATENFSLSNQLGTGGFGSVYKGKMPNGEEIAVKKLAVGSNQGVEEFSNEVMLLLRMQHRNLVKLLGCCVQREDRMLVYEYLHNKSLDCFLFDKSKSAILDWSKRFNIIVGIARGLLYLHEDSQLRIIHRDIKASNILLDEQMYPKISDFGLARLFPDELSQVRTRRIAGTVGYMAPEYAVRGLLSVKSDVFSFGVLILEIISGRKNYDSQLEEHNKELLNLTWQLDREGRLMELVDVNIGSCPQPEVLKCIRIGLLCCQESIQERPVMSSILVMLSNESVTTPLPGRPAYYGSSADNTVEPFERSDSVNSSITFTELSGR
ncbi:hypothetical protein IFM89_025617 [Coptis chinensis]|uniref:Uncharacterized protein n=1 Tax=Coptis chinensis TaxID=261450 RepID=A0A835H8S9_9MAGN|nr:hypothetical protein IFM89_025617 [Coptis chinensis]